MYHSSLCEKERWGEEKKKKRKSINNPQGYIFTGRSKVACFSLLAPGGDFLYKLLPLPPITAPTLNSGDTFF